MNVPFISSGALGRVHYALVRKVEEATSEGLVNRILESEIKSTRVQLTQPGLSLKRTKEALIVLLYCSMTATAPIFSKGAFGFALPHALSLAEAGTTVEDKRIGYLFCTEMMPPDHEMRILLVNTLRKDLEDDGISRICLALDNIIMTSSADVIPAVQSRLYDLLSHNHPSVRRRALYATRSLSHHGPELLSQAHSKILRRLRDQDGSVTRAALKVAETSFNINPGLAPTIQDAVNDVFEDGVRTYSPVERGSIIVSLGIVHGVGLRTLSLPAAFDLLASCSSAHDAMTILGLYRLFKQFSAAALSPVEEQTHTSLIGSIRDYLTSRTPNEIYLFLSCLESVDPGLWAGTSEAIPAVLEAWEVEQIMHFLDSNDNLIRKKTLHILGEVDQSILDAYYTQAVSATTRLALPLKELNERTRRLLEILEILTGANGELYASEVRDLLARVERHVAGNGILDSAIEGTLTHIRLKEPSFQVSCAATILTFLCDVDATFGPTMVVILAALATEYSRLVSLSPTELLSGLCHRLKGSLPAVQEPCLLAMLRIAADCEEIPLEVTKTISEAGQNAGRHIRRRCDQFLTLSGQKATLLEIIAASRSFALPDFLEALEICGDKAEDKGERSDPEAKFPQIFPHPTRTAGPGTSASKLRYEAYDTPQPIPSLRSRPPNSRGSALGSRSSLEPVSSVSPVRELLAHTVSGPKNSPTAMLSEELDHFVEEQPNPNPTAETMEDLSARVDLIAFDSPFTMEQPQDSNDRTKNARRELDFESIWNSVEDHQYNARGWCDASLENVIKRLHGIQQHRIQVVPVDVSPFMGDLKIMIVPDGLDGGQKAALLRLRDTEEDGSLWRLRCRGGPLRERVKEILGNQ